MDNNNNFGNNSNDNLNNSFGNTPDITGGNDQPINPYTSSDYSQPINPYANSGYGQTPTDPAQSSFGSQSSSYGAPQSDFSQTSYSQPPADFSQSSYGNTASSAPIFQQQAQSYAPPQANTNAYHLQDLETPVSMGDWIVSLILCCIPCVNIIMLFVWAFSKTEPKSKSNWAKAQLIFVGVILVLYVILIIIGVGGALSTYGINH